MSPYIQDHNIEHEDMEEGFVKAMNELSLGPNQVNYLANHLAITTKQELLANYGLIKEKIRHIQKDATTPEYFVHHLSNKEGISIRKIKKLQHYLQQSDTWNKRFCDLDGYLHMMDVMRGQQFKPSSQRTLAQKHECITGTLICFKNVFFISKGRKQVEIHFRLFCNVLCSLLERATMSLEEKEQGTPPSSPQTYQQLPPTPTVPSSPTPATTGTSASSLFKKSKYYFMMKRCVFEILAKMCEVKYDVEGRVGVHVVLECLGYAFHRHRYHAFLRQTNPPTPGPSFLLTASPSSAFDHSSSPPFQSHSTVLSNNDLPETSTTYSSTTSLSETTPSEGTSSSRKKSKEKQRRGPHGSSPHRPYLDFSSFSSSSTSTTPSTSTRHHIYNERPIQRIYREPLCQQCIHKNLLLKECYLAIQDILPFWNGSKNLANKVFSKLAQNTYIWESIQPAQTLEFHESVISGLVCSILELASAILNHLPTIQEKKVAERGFSQLGLQAILTEIFKLRPDSFVMRRARNYETLRNTLYSSNSSSTSTTSSHPTSHNFSASSSDM